MLGTMLTNKAPDPLIWVTNANHPRYQLITVLIDQFSNFPIFLALI